MKRVLLLLAAIGFWCCGCDKPAASPASRQQFLARGVVKEIKSNSLLVAHEEITNYMPAMTMSFRARQTNELAGLNAGDEISFRLVVTADQSWIEQIRKTGARSVAPLSPLPQPTNKPAQFRLTDIPDFMFTNEFGQRVSLRQFQGQALAFTFFFTRCPIPEYCPRLAKNFQGASERLVQMSDAPTNWHLLSISFDPFDTPAALRAYAQSYHYNSNHWTFLTGPVAQVRDFADGFGVRITPEGGTFTHNFRTVVFDAAGRLQNSWMIGGDTTDHLVSEILQAAQARENHAASRR